MTKKLLFVFAILPAMLFAQHSVKGTFSPADQFKFAFLYRVTAETSLFVGNADVDENGKFEIKLDSTAVPGTYRIVYAQPQNEYNFDLLVNGKEDVELSFDLEKGLSFQKSNENKIYKSYNRSIALVNKSIRNYYGSGDTDKKGFSKIFEVLTKTQNEFESASKGMIANHFIKACKPYIPSEYEDVLTFSKNIKDNYFKNIDFGNEQLQNSNFLINNSISYVFNFVDRNNPNQSYQDNLDMLIKAMGNNPKVKKTILEILWNKFEGEKNEVSANYLASKYLLPIAKAENDKELIDNLTYFEMSSIGKIAPDFDIEIKDKKDKIKKTKLSELDNAENYLVIFWNSTCSHCLDELPILKEYAASLEKGKLQVVAVALDNDKYRWKNMTYDYPDFYHVYGEGKWENEIGNRYNAKATPSYFVLDKNKTILAKPYDFPEFKPYFDGLLEHKKEN
ncbi:TlpA disulfide reductase family protein [uncultured Lacinutrix sp.]|uniref:TlpA family protein disulfide reductase n=1 Tax=uncultured Lacinutrix sp. TaxID=574032 RepID=UPI0026227960|nr:TlpA disulfide reductase family protein [uncultured Lacinutrix sp.]